MRRELVTLPKFLVTGCNGQLGFELRRSLAPLGQVVALNRRDCDLRSPAAIREAVSAIRPDVIVNAAAYTAVDQAEDESEAAFAINGTAPGVLAELAAEHQSLVVHYSTDYVFDGSKPAAYLETDVARPLSVYGASKLAGESAIAATDAAALVLRTSWLFSARGTNFLRSILASAQMHDSLQVVSDQQGAPTSAALVADVTAQIVARHWLYGDRATFPRGVYHLSAAGHTTWHAYATEVLRYAAAKGIALKTVAACIEAIPAAQRASSARRPANSLLDTCKLRDTFGVHLPDWRDGVHLVLDQTIS